MNLLTTGKEFQLTEIFFTITHYLIMAQNILFSFFFLMRFVAVLLCTEPHVSERKIERERVLTHGCTIA